MLLIDDLLMSPVRGLMFVLREVAKSAEAEEAAVERTVMAELSALHRSLDNGEITEEAFDAQESRLLAQLDHIRGTEPGDGTGSNGI
jgi:hypothetical protein